MSSLRSKPKTVRRTDSFDPLRVCCYRALKRTARTIYSGASVRHDAIGPFELQADSASEGGAPVSYSAALTSASCLLLSSREQAVMEGASSDHFNLPLLNHEDHGSTCRAAAEDNTSDMRHQPSSLAQWSDQKRMIEGEGLQSDYQRGYQAVGTLKSGQGDAGASPYHHAGDATNRAREWVAFQTFLLAQKERQRSLRECLSKFHDQLAQMESPAANPTRLQTIPLCCIQVIIRRGCRYSVFSLCYCNITNATG